jgi:shikimate dehydrogenase
VSGPSNPSGTAPGKVLVGLVGAGIQRSLSPAMHEEEARAQGVPLHYQLIDLDRRGLDARALPGLLDAARTFGFAGLNVTFPCKQAIVPLLDALSDEAEAIGAVNTVVIRDDRLVGHNTDGSGWRWGFERALPGADLSCVALLGAGGAGSAIAHALLRMGSRKLRLVDADHGRAVDLAIALQVTYPGCHVAAVAAAEALPGATGLVHASPTGMDKLPGMPLEPALLRSDLWVSEVVYFPLDTALLREARARGCRVADGGGMAVGQALGAFELFTGLRADPARVDAHFRSLVGQRRED